jgi:hypothetical protein
VRNKICDKILAHTSKNDEKAQHHFSTLNNTSTVCIRVSRFDSGSSENRSLFLIVFWNQETDLQDADCERKGGGKERGELK